MKHHSSRMNKRLFSTLVRDGNGKKMCNTHTRTHSRNDDSDWMLKRQPKMQTIKWAHSFWTPYVHCRKKEVYNSIKVRTHSDRHHHTMYTYLFIYSMFVHDAQTHTQLLSTMDKSSFEHIFSPLIWFWKKVQNTLIISEPGNRAILSFSPTLSMCICISYWCKRVHQIIQWAMSCIECNFVRVWVCVLKRMKYNKTRFPL